MTTRRDFLKVSAAAGGGLALAFPLGATAQGVSPEINAWVVVKPDDQVIIRIARSEMGQGTLTGLAQLVAQPGGQVGRVLVEPARHLGRRPQRG